LGTAVTNITIQDSDISYCGTYGISVSSISTDVLIDNCTIHYNCNRGDVDSLAAIKCYDASSQDIIIENCDIHDNGQGVTGARGVGIWIDTVGTGVIVRYNKCYDNYYHGLLIERSSSVQMYYNLSYGNTGNASTAGIAVTGNSGGNANSNTGYNNVCYNNGVRGLWLYGDGVTSDCIKDNLTHILSPKRELPN